MKYFKLPDLGEGLHESEIVEWHIEPGAIVSTGQVLVSVETDKAIVDIPSPCDGAVVKCFGQAGDIIHVGDPLLEFAAEDVESSVSVVGRIETESAAINREHFIIGSPYNHDIPRTTPSIRALAKTLQVDLQHVTGTGHHDMITSDDVELMAKLNREYGPAQMLKGSRRSMARNMASAHEEVVKVTIHDDADVGAWHTNNDIMLRLMRAMKMACQAEPILNAWYDSRRDTFRVIEQINLGIAVDSSDGLFVPVIRNLQQLKEEQQRHELNRLRDAVMTRSILPQELTGATITLSNFGSIAGRYGNPIIIPPTVAIMGTGRMYNHKKNLPLSLSFDHRVITGGEAARFLRAAMEDLSLEQ